MTQPTFETALLAVFDEQGVVDEAARLVAGHFDADGTETDAGRGTVA